MHTLQLPVRTSTIGTDAPDIHEAHALLLKQLQVTTATFVAAVDPGTRFSFPFARCRYLSIFGILLVNK